MESGNLPKGQSTEATPGKRRNLPGIYVHKESGAKFITQEGNEGSIQADALIDNPLWKSGWERVGDVPTRIEQLEMRKAQEDTNVSEIKKGN